MPQPTDKFSHPITIQPTDIDELGHVNNVVYLRWVQEVAVAHWDAVATGELKEQYAWVVLRHEIDYHQAALLGDSIIGYTWVGEHSGARIIRYVSLYKEGSDKPLAATKTSWCLLDAKTMRPRRLEEEIAAIFK